MRVGDVVRVYAGRVPHRVLKGTGRIHQITYHGPDSTIVPPGTPIYWVEGLATGKAAEQLEPTGEFVGPAGDTLAELAAGDTGAPSVTSELLKVLKDVLEADYETSDGDYGNVERGLERADYELLARVKALIAKAEGT